MTTPAPKDPTSTNPIREIVKARVLSLLGLSNALEHVSHDTTRGDIREDYLIQFFADLVPSQLKIKKGLICDSLGNSSKQTDFIVYDPTVLPIADLSANVGIIPVEAVFLQAEIKSTITTSTIKQVDEQLSRLSSLRFATDEKTAQQCVVPTVVLGYSNKVGKSRLCHWIQESDPALNLVALCVINKFCILRVGKTDVKLVESDTDKLEPTLRFLCSVYDVLRDIADMRGQLTAEWKQYLVSP